jgi:hypothetical protein
MVKQKRKGGHPMDAGPAVSARAKSEAESFGQRWGMELTSRETERVVEQALSKVHESGGDVKIRPAIRDQMFAMLIKKDPTKAISFRMSMHEKRGAELSAEQKNRVREVAKEEGWRAARAELASVLKPEEGRKETVPSKRRETAKRARAGMERKRAGPKAQARGGKDAQAPVEGEAEAQNAYRLAMQKNRELKGVVLKCKGELRLLKEEYYGEGGKMEDVSKERGEELLAEYREKGREIQGRYQSRANALKKERDSYAKRYIRAGTMSLVGAGKMGKKKVKDIMGRQLERMVQFEGATSMGKGYGVKEFTKDDLGLGAAERNVANFEVRIKTWEAGRLGRLSKVG